MPTEGMRKTARINLLGWCGRRGRKVICGLLARRGRHNRLIIAIEDVNNGPADHPCPGFAVYVRGERKISDIGIILGKLQVLDEEGWRFDDLSLDSDQAASIGVNEHPSLEQPGTLQTWLEMKHMNQPAVHTRCAFVRELVILLVDCGQRSIILLDVIHFRLQQACDDIALHKAVARVMHRSELESMRRGEAAFDLKLSLLIRFGKLRVNDCDSRIGSQLL